jgi:hypothetical protein
MHGSPKKPVLACCLHLGNQLQVKSQVDVSISIFIMVFNKTNVALMKNGIMISEL